MFLPLFFPLNVFVAYENVASSYFSLTFYAV